MDNNNILQKLEGLESRYEEVSTLITDPDVIADQPRYVKLTKEWKDLGDISTRTRRCSLNLKKKSRLRWYLRTQKTPRTYRWKSEAVPEATRQPSLQATYLICIRNTANRRDGPSA